MITLKNLVEYQACTKAQSWFALNFGWQAEVTPENLYGVRPAWLYWLAQKIDPSFSWWIAGIAYREAANLHPQLEKFSGNVSAENYLEARRVAASIDVSGNDAAIANARYISVYASINIAPDVDFYPNNYHANESIKREIRMRAFEIILARFA